MKLDQLVAVFSCVFFSTVPCLASWPSLSCEVGQLTKEEDAVKGFPSIVTSQHGAYIKGPRFTAISIDYQEKRKLYTCSLTVGYAERKDWSALNHRDIIKSKWKVFPVDSKPDMGGELRNLTTLIATIDSLGLQAVRSSCERVSVDSKETYGVWNRLDVVVNENETLKLLKIVLAYMKSLDENDEITCYVKQE